MKIQILFVLLGVVAAAPLRLSLIDQYVNNGVRQYLKESYDTPKMLAMRLLSNMNLSPAQTGIPKIYLKNMFCLIKKMFKIVIKRSII